MNIALWDFPYSDLIEKALRSTIGSVDAVLRTTGEDCMRALVAGKVDLALIPTISALQNGDLVDVFPAFAVSSWSYPYARIRLPQGLQQLPSTLTVPSAYPQEAFVASLVLQEHYQSKVTTVLDRSGELPTDARLVINDTMSDLEGLDLGQEWYELANYPMVWGVFATLNGNASQPLIRAVADAAAIAERSRLSETVTGDSDEAHFVRNDLRFRFDDLAMASITELTQYLFYYHGNDEIDVLALVHLSDDDQDEPVDLPSV